VGFAANNDWQILPRVDCISLIYLNGK
jgi:hypothetical protein